jgi:hypothetical protein
MFLNKICPELANVLFVKILYLKYILIKPRVRFCEFRIKLSSFLRMRRVGERDN